MKHQAIALLSGGLDSGVASYLAREECNIVQAITFDYGQRARSREVEAASSLCRQNGISHQVIEIPWLADLAQTALISKNSEVPRPSFSELDDKSRSLERARQVWVPNRNGLFANIAACFADARSLDAIIMGFNAEEGASFADNTHEFAESLDTCFSMSTLAHPKILSPTVRLNKEEVARLAAEFGYTDFWSCYHGGERMCGRCESCMRTVRAFKRIGHFDLIAGRFEEVME